MSFIIGLMIGGAIGVIAMALVSRSKSDDLQDHQEYYETGNTVDEKPVKHPMPISELIREGEEKNQLKLAEMPKGENNSL